MFCVVNFYFNFYCSQLKKDIKMTNIEELQIQSETYYQEVNCYGAVIDSLSPQLGNRIFQLFVITLISYFVNLELFCIINWIVNAILLVLICELLEDKRTVDVTINKILFCCHITQIDSMLRWFCTIKDHRRYQNVLITLVTHSKAPFASLFYS